MSIPLWALVHLPVVVTLSTAAFTPNGWVHSILYVLFENAMGIVKLGAVIAGAPLTCPWVMVIIRVRVSRESNAAPHSFPLVRHRCKDSIEHTLPSNVARCKARFPPLKIATACCAVLAGERTHTAAAVSAPAVTPVLCDSQA